MTPAELVAALQAKAVATERAEVSMRASAAAALKGFRVPGHRIAMSGGTVRISGPRARAVAAEVVRRAGPASRAAVVREVSGA